MQNTKTLERIKPFITSKLYSQINSNNTILLTLKEKWYKMIESGQKHREYRDINTYWEKRLEDKKIEYIIFTNGYGDVPTLIVECKEVKKGLGLPQLGAKLGVEYYILKLGEILFNSKYSKK